MAGDAGPRGLPKLVRDRIPEVIEHGGSRPRVRRLAPVERGAALRSKLAEELAEFDAADSADDRLDELADMLELVCAMAHAIGASESELRERRAQKATERGTFEQGWLLEGVED